MQNPHFIDGEMSHSGNNLPKVSSREQTRSWTSGLSPLYPLSHRVYTLSSHPSNAFSSLERSHLFSNIAFWEENLVFTGEAPDQLHSSVNTECLQLWPRAGGNKDSACWHISH